MMEKIFCSKREQGVGHYLRSLDTEPKTNITITPVHFSSFSIFLTLNDLVEMWLYYFKTKVILTP